MHSTQLRREHIHGALLGIAVGESLGYARSGLTRRRALKFLGRPPFRFRYLPGRGIYGEQTRLALLNAQAILNCRSDLRILRRTFARRLRWHVFGMSIAGRRETLAVSLRSWFLRLGLAPGIASRSNGAASRAIISTLAINGTGHRVAKWIEESTKLTHTDPVAIDGCCALALLADRAVEAKKGDFDPLAALEVAIASIRENELRKKFLALKPYLEQGLAPSRVAKRFGWRDRISQDVVPTAVMAAYCFLRFPRDYRKAVESAIALGGQSAAMGAIVGGLAGAHLGEQGIPQELKSRQSGTPHGPEWIEKMAERFSHWPHGVDDLHLAPAQSSDPLTQVLRNLIHLPLGILHGLLRIPVRLLVRPGKSKTRQQ